MNKLEEIVDYYKEHKSTLASQMVAWPLSTATAACSTQFADSPAGAVALSTTVAQATYWPIFIAGKVLSDRKEFINDGKIDGAVLRRKIGEYASWFGAGEFVYSAVRGVVMSGLKVAGMDDAESSAYTDIATGSAYTSLIPFMEDAIYRFNKVVDEKVIQPIIGFVKSAYKNVVGGE